MKQSKEEPYTHNPNFQIKFPGKEGYNFGSGKGCLSPCMDDHWRSKK